MLYDYCINIFEDWYCNDDITMKYFPQVATNVQFSRIFKTQTVSHFFCSSI